MTVLDRPILHLNKHRDRHLRSLQPVLAIVYCAKSLFNFGILTALLSMIIRATISKLVDYKNK